MHLFHDTDNSTTLHILSHALMAALSLFVNGFGIYLTIRAGIGVSPWDVLNIGVANTFGILYGTASITISCIILGIDLLLREPIGLAMLIDAVVVGKSVDFFYWLDPVPPASSLPMSLALLVLGLFILGYTQYIYMAAALGCGPRDTLLVGLKRRTRRLPIGAVSIALLSAATLIGWLLGGPVGLGTLVCAFLAGPIMQLAFRTVGFDATGIRHQSLPESLRVLLRRQKKAA